jgi:thiamine-monophosphate kinase
MKRRPKSQTDRSIHSAKNEEQILAKLCRSGSLGDPARGLRMGIGDDAALFSPRIGFQTILTCDWFLEGTHFLRHKHPADAIGWKCLARAVSDVAAMGGTPRCFLLSLALPAALTGSWLDAFLAGLRRAQRRLGCVLAGGDTTKSNRILIQVTVIGEVRSGVGVLRSGARPGDLIYVSGRLGEAESGLRRLLAQKRIDPSDPALRKHLYPEPRLHIGSWLAKSRLATAMLDLSDGLSSDLARLCAASKVGARIEAGRLPLPFANGAQRAELLGLSLHGGDDYELLFTVSPANRRRIPRNSARVRLTQIGEITRQGPLELVDTQGSRQALVINGWDPFRTQRSIPGT